MLQFLIDYAVPVTIFVLMLISGAKVRTAGLPKVVTATRTLVLGSADQLLVLPFVALLTQVLSQPSQLVTTILLLLALCQGGGISNYYVCCPMQCPSLGDDHGSQYDSLFFANSAFIRLFQLCSARQCGSENFRPKTVVMQLLALMILPMLIGSLLTRVLPVTVN
jgi:predicted Na+-dependent transporter